MFLHKPVHTHAYTYARARSSTQVYALSLMYFKVAFVDDIHDPSFLLQWHGSKYS